MAKTNSFLWEVIDYLPQGKEVTVRKSGDYWDFTFEMSFKEPVFLVGEILRKIEMRKYKISVEKKGDGFKFTISPTGYLKIKT